MVPYVRGRCQARGWYCIYDYCLGWISAWGSHILSILQWAWDTRKAGNITVEGAGTITNEGLNDNLIQWDTNFHFGNGVEMTFKTGPSNSVVFVGSEGRVTASDGGCNSEPASLWKEPLGPNDRPLAGGDLGSNFIECCRTRKTTMSPVDEAAYSDILSHLADIAIRLKRKVTWDPAKEQFVGDADAARMMTRAVREPWTF